MPENTEPKILAIDTSSDVCSVALTNAGLIKEETVVAAREHTQRLLPMVDSVLSQSGICLKDLDAIAVANGPGSFTGLRIGLSIAQGLCYGADLPLIPVSTLAAMASSVVRKGSVNDEHVIVSAIDARMNEIYWSAYHLGIDKVSTNRAIQLIDAEKVSSPVECYQYCQSLKSDNVIAVGSGWRYALSESHIVFKTNTEFYSTAYDVAELALAAFARGQVIDPMHAQPTYLRNEITWQKRRRIRS
ncbi:MAG: tRNA threonylcarbamoyladenosine biosynthesis protein TsaB [Cellvibrionaceae bacterium]|jgi:tRNA threonylcarbamoyladenosine biosynthesis protein TsaB